MDTRLPLAVSAMALAPPPPAAPAGLAAEPAVDRPLADIEAVLREHGGMLARIAGSYEAEPARRDDLLQEISLAVWRALPAWRGDASLRTFVARVAHNRAIDHLSRERRARGDELHDQYPDDGPGPAGHAEARQRQRALLAAVRRLPLGQRQVVVLALEGFAHAEMAQALGLEPNTVTQRLSRARRQLQQWLSEDA